MGVVLSAGDLVLRPAEDCGLARLRRFFGQPGVYADWGGVPLSDDDLRSRYLGARIPLVAPYLAEWKGTDVGFTLLHVADDGGEGGGMDLVLAPEWRGAGVGARVVALVADHVVHDLKWCRFTVDPDVDNVAGTRFWRRVGFIPVKRIDEHGRRPYWLMRWSPTEPTSSAP